MKDKKNVSPLIIQKNIRCFLVMKNVREQKNKVKVGPWSNEEDIQLMEMQTSLGSGGWV